MDSAEMLGDEAAGHMTCRLIFLVTAAGSAGAQEYRQNLQHRYSPAVILGDTRTKRDFDIGYMVVTIL